MGMSGKVGIVTAAASGMGRAGAKRFAAEGARIAIVDRDEAGLNSLAEEIEAAGGTALPMAGDLRDMDFSAQIVQRTVANFGRLDFLWNHLGHPGPSKFEDLEWDAFDLCLDLNVRSIVATTKAAIPHLRAAGGGSILCTSSTAGLNGSPASPLYSLTKFGIIGMVRSLSKRLAADNIRINAICPGSVDTPMLRSFVARDDVAGSEGLDKERLAMERGGRNPMGRPGRPEEIASAALFLLSDEASFVTGIAMPVDGGSLAVMS